MAAELTMKRARELAHQARRYGYHAAGPLLWVVCPVCASRVETSRAYRWRLARKGEPGSTNPRIMDGQRAVFDQENARQALDRAMVAHLRSGEECSAPPS